VKQTGLQRPHFNGFQSCAVQRRSRVLPLIVSFHPDTAFAVREHWK